MRRQAQFLEKHTLSAQQLRTLAAELIEKVGKRDRELHLRQTRIDQLTHEIALLKRFRYGARSEQLHAGQASLLEESLARRWYRRACRRR